MPFRRTRKEYLHSCAEKILLFHSHISFYVHVKTPSPAKTASFLISTGARSSASCNILFSPESVHRREPAGRYTGDLAGDTFGRITYGNSAYSRFPGS